MSNSFFASWNSLVLFMLLYKKAKQQKNRKRRNGITTGCGCDVWEYTVFWKIQVLQIIQVRRFCISGKKEMGEIKCIIIFVIVYASQIYITNQVNNKDRRGRQYTHFNSYSRRQKRKANNWQKLILINLQIWLWANRSQANRIQKLTLINL